MNELNAIGKLPPQAPDLELGVLGALLLSVDAIHVIKDILQPESFYAENNQIIYKAILGLHKKSIHSDILSVTDELKKTSDLEKVGGVYYISQLANNESQQYEYHARIIQQKFIQRELIRISSETIKNAYNSNADCFELLEELDKNITSINKDFSVGKIAEISSLWKDVYQHNQILLSKKGISGVPSGYLNLDTITGGWQQPDLIIIAARPAMGKTSLVCNFARNASVDHKYPGVIFSLEMSSRQIATRIFALESEVSITDFTRKGIPLNQMTMVESICSKLINAPLFIDDTAAISITELRSKARKLKREKNIKYIVVDYLQLMSGEKTSDKSRNREQEISGISRGLKALAKELEIPVIALSQLSRSVETRGGDKRPILSDLRESGAIEQDADIVIFIHRPEYYGVSEYEDGESTHGVAEIIFSKHRNGATGTEKLKFIDRLTKFVSIENEYTPSALQPNYKDFTEPLSEPF